MLSTRFRTDRSHSLGGVRKSWFCALRDIAKILLSGNGHGLYQVIQLDCGCKNVRISNVRCVMWELMTKSIAPPSGPLVYILVGPIYPVNLDLGPIGHAHFDPSVPQ